MDDVVSIQNKTFQLTLDILRKQRDAQTDLVVQLSVQVAMLAELNAAQQQSLTELQRDNLLLNGLYEAVVEDRTLLRAQLHELETRQTLANPSSE